MEIKAALTVIGLLAVCLPSSCVGVSQERYDLIQADLTEAQAQVAGLKMKLETEQTNVEQIRSEIEYYKSEIESYKAENSRLREQMWANEAEIARLDEELSKYQANIPIYKFPTYKPVSDYVEPMNPSVRDKAVSIVSDAPPSINTVSETWKIWQINYWVANNISYVKDPSGGEYFAHAHETLEAEGGDCDDFAILLASLYESVGLDAVVAYIDTTEDRGADHMACLVYYSKDNNAFLREVQSIMSKLNLHSPTDEQQVLSFQSTGPILQLKGSAGGIWITVDPTMAAVRDLVAYVTHETYEIVTVVDVGD